MYSLKFPGVLPVAGNFFGSLTGGNVDILKCAPVFPAHGSEQRPAIIELVITGDLDKSGQCDLGIRKGRDKRKMAKKATDK